MNATRRALIARSATAVASRPAARVAALSTIAPSRKVKREVHVHIHTYFFVCTTGNLLRPPLDGGLQTKRGMMPGGCYLHEREHLAPAIFGRRRSTVASCARKDWDLRVFPNRACQSVIQVKCSLQFFCETRREAKEGGSTRARVCGLCVRVLALPSDSLDDSPRGKLARLFLLSSQETRSNLNSGPGGSVYRWQKPLSLYNREG